MSPYSSRVVNRRRVDTGAITAKKPFHSVKYTKGIHSSTVSTRFRYIWEKCCRVIAYKENGENEWMSGCF